MGSEGNNLGPEFKVSSRSNLMEQYGICNDSLTNAVCQELDEKEDLANKQLARLGFAHQFPGVEWSLEKNGLIANKNVRESRILTNEDIRAVSRKIKGEDLWDSPGLTEEFKKWYEQSEHKIIFSILDIQEYLGHLRDDPEEVERISTQEEALRHTLSNPESALERRRVRFALAHNLDYENEKDRLLINDLIYAND